jgi:hypothetical protein
MMIGFSLAPLARAEADLRLEVRHDHLWGDRTGTLLINGQGLSYRESATEKQKKGGDRPHAWDWNYDDIQQLEISNQAVRILTYNDNRWRLGADRQHEFELRAGEQLRPAYDFLRTKLDQRFVASLADASVEALWELRVKRQKRFGGTHGLLAAGHDRLVFTAGEKGASRTWRFSDIDNISTSGPFQLSITTFERARAQYGSRKTFNFQLKQPITETQYNSLWRRLNQSKSLQILALEREP